MAIKAMYSDINEKYVKDGRGDIKISLNGDAVKTSLINILSTRKGSRCFSGDTKIPLINGDMSSICELVGKEFYVYSYNLITNDIEPAKATAFCTGEQRLLRITLDNDRVINCTPDHLFLMRDGTYKKATDLSVCDSLMPLYRFKNKSGYETTFGPRLNKCKAKTRCGIPLWKTVEKVLKSEDVVINHKVKSIVPLDDTEFVYDLHVEKNNNFALHSGVFVHNCMLPEFGASLEDILFEDFNVDIAKLISERIKKEVARWDDRINLVKIDFKKDEDKGTMNATVIFTVAGDNEVLDLTIPIGRS